MKPGKGAGKLFNKAKAKSRGFSQDLWLRVIRVNMSLGFVKL